jgi:hypothetical protein
VLILSIDTEHFATPSAAEIAELEAELAPWRQASADLFWRLEASQPDND